MGKHETDCILSETGRKEHFHESKEALLGWQNKGGPYKPAQPLDFMTLLDSKLHRLSLSQSV